MGLLYDLKLALRPPKWSLRHQSLRYAGKTEPEIHLLPFLVRPHCVAIDGGANKGVYSWWLSKYCETVHAFEPNPKMFGYMRRAVPANVKPYNLALAKNKETRTFYLPTSGSKEHHTRGSLHKVKARSKSREFIVNCIAIDDLNLENVGFIKLDVEGAELDCLLGAEKTLRRCRPVIMAEVTGIGQSKQEELIQYLRQSHYEILLLNNGILTHLHHAAPLPPIERNCLFLPSSSPEGLKSGTSAS